MSEPLQVFTCISFTGYWPVGTAAVVVASTPAKAAQLLNKRLRRQGLPGDAEIPELFPVAVTEETVLVLRDGDY